MKRKFLFLMVISMPYILISQIPNHLPLTSNTKKASAQQSNKLYFLTTESFPLEEKGRRFLQNNFVEGTIVDFENEAFKVPIRYRFADDEMQIKHLNKIKALYLQKIKRITFEVNNEVKTFISTEYVEKKVENLGYFEVVSQGDLTLLKAYRKKGKEDVKVCYFVKKNNELAKVMKFKKSSILRVFGDRKSAISKYIAKNHLNIKSEIGLKKVFDYYNSLEK